MSENHCIKPGVYRHYKGKEYDVYGVAVLSGTEDSQNPSFNVIYRPRYGARLLTHREFGEFTGLVVMDGQPAQRFVFVRTFSEAEAKIVSSLLGV